MPNLDAGRTRQFNLRLTDEELSTLTLLAAQNGATPSEYFRFLLRQAAEGARRTRLGIIHLDVLAAMVRDSKAPKSAVELINEVPNRGDDPWFGQNIFRALVVLEGLGFAERSKLPGYSYSITPAGVERAKKR